MKIISYIWYSNPQVMTTILKRLFLVLVITCIYPYAFSQVNDSIYKSSLTSMSLEELLDIEINIGTFTPSSALEIPVSATIITKEDILLTPARNVLDLIEIYVPGATFTNHWLGPRLGVRGVAGDQNTSYLLLLNGQNINMKTLNGPFYEIQNRDLNDIESIEVIRGPGSVTYGDGAIGGIINIKTLSDNTCDEKIMGGIEGNSNYRYANAFIKGAFHHEKWTINYYTSFNKSQGEKNSEYFYIDRAHGYGYGFLGQQWGNKNLGTPPPNLYSDLRNRPQIKAQINIKYDKAFNFWARYSDISFIKQQQQSKANDQYYNPGILGKQFISVAEYHPVLTKSFKVFTDIGFLSQSNRDIALYNINNAPFEDITQRNFSYAQNELFLNARMNYNYKELFNIAVGGSYRYLYLGPEWGMEKHEFINSFPAPLRFVVYDSVNSGFFQKYGNGMVSQVDDRIDAYQYSLFTEIKFTPLPYLTFLLSTRLDKHEYSKHAFSPRVAIISKLNSKNTIKFIAQQAVRLPTFNELYAFNHIENKEISPEVKKGIELIYQYLPQKNIYFDASVFYNTIDQIAWISNGYPDVVGTFDLLGIELELAYKAKKTRGSISYSFIHQENWDPIQPMEAHLSNIGIDSLDVPLPNFGVNRINNFPKHSVKFYINHNINEYFRLHFDARLCWDYGQEDMLNSYIEVHENYGTEATQNEMQNITTVLTKYGYSKPSFTSNFSFSYKPEFLMSSEIQFYAMNILQFNHMRYVYQYWEVGNNRQYPRQVGFIKEPTSIGIKLIWHVGSK